MNMRDLYFYTKKIAKPIYRLEVGDRIQLLHSPGMVTKINKSATGNIKIFWKKEMIHAFQPSWKVYGKKSVRTEFMLMAK